MTTAFATAGYTTSGDGSQGIMARIAAAVAAAMARAKARQSYRQMLENEDLLRDVGVTRDDVRRALQELRGGL
jgi:uncharacterized protein YjiS (DUF1127 family)